jgi:sec-independent protein translocase protein TatB
MSLPDTIFIFALALIIFGPKKLPEIGRQIGKLVFEFRRASNEFKLQIEEELRAAEAADRKAQAAALVSSPPPASVTTSDSPGPLTIRPPATGAIVSAGPPTAGVAAAENGPVSPRPVTSPEISEDGVSKVGVSEGPDGYLKEEPGEQNQPGGEPVHNHHG